MVQDRAILTMADQYIESRIMVYRTAPFSMTLNDPNPVFKVTPFFDAEYVTNDHSCCKMKIGKHTQAFEWCHFQLP